MLVNTLADDDVDGDRARERLLADTDLHAPTLIDLEVVSVLRPHVAAGDLDDRRARLAIIDLHTLSMTRYPHLPLVERVWELRHNLTPYDASYVALAEALKCTLVTADHRLCHAPGPLCPVEQIGDLSLIHISEPTRPY